MRTIASDVAAISRIDAVKRILDVVCQLTGLGFSAVARVTDKQWVACAVRDAIAFGLKPGGELDLQTTICNEIRCNGDPVAIDHVAIDPVFSKHPTPARYGFQSYISVPIHMPDGHFFGTLCAIDPKPARVNTAATIGMFKLFADLIALHLDAQQRVINTEASLLYERSTSHKRERIFETLCNEIHEPLKELRSAAKSLAQIELPESASELAQRIERDARRMESMIDDTCAERVGDGV